MNDEKLKKIEELEKTLHYFIKPDMDIDKKIKILSNSYWRAHNAGYCDHMAWQRMAGVDDEQVEQHDLDCKYKWDVESLLELLTELKNEKFEELWQKASDLFDKDNEAGFKAWLELCESGCAHAAHSVGWCYHCGNGVEKDDEKAEEYYKLAINGGYAASYNGLYWTYVESGKPEEENFHYLYEGASLGSASCYETLSCLCDDGKIHGGNKKVAAYFATRAYEIDKKCGEVLALYYLNGKFFPRVYPYAKYCLENSTFTRADFEELGAEFPEYWDDIEPIEPVYPDFGLTLGTCDGSVDPDELFSKAQELMFSETPDREAAKPYVLEAAKAGSSQAMYYTYILDIDGWQEFLVRGADEYGDLDCIELLAALFSEQATYRIGNPFLNEAIKYWNRRKKLHGNIPVSEANKEAFEIYNRGLDRVFGRMPRKVDPETNAVLLRTDGSPHRWLLREDKGGF
ncbi:MAG: sel1 repeat family protein [Clostridia bacterium]|nr:sel1 repeat family protein [Clostridia bacterium]